MNQSALHPAGPAASHIAGLWWYLFTVSAVVFAATMGLLIVAVVRRPREAPGPHSGTGLVLVGGIVLPGIILVITLFISLSTTMALKNPARGLTVQVIGHQWWWEVRYPQQGIATANEITVPAGRPVRLELDSVDVVHSFWAPSLNGKMDLVPGHPNTFWISADHPGVYRGQCAEYCGLQHAHMAFEVHALSPDAFQQWLASEQQPHTQSADPAIARGKQVFFGAACKDCHTISGTAAHGKIGPDLTHVASRHTLAAGTLPNTPGTLEGWISDSQSIKPGNKMPRTFLKPEDLHAVRAYLETLN